MPEQFANLAETTLSAAYVAGQGFLQVTSTSGFPSLPIFRVRLGNAGKTVFRVDYVYGTRFYGAAEANDAAGLSGDTVTQVITQKTLERFLQAPETGAVTDPIFAPSGAQGLRGYGPIYPYMNNLDQSGWAWVNQGTGAYFVQNGGGPVYFHVPSRSGTNLTARAVAQPARPYQIIAGWALNMPSAGSVSNLQAAGIGLRESGTGKLQVFLASNFKFSTANGPGAIWLGTYSSPTGASSVLNEKVVGTDFGGNSNSSLAMIGGIIWLSLKDDGVNVIWEYSFDRLTWFLHTRQARTTGFTTAPDQMAIVLNCQSSTPPLDAWLMSWEQKASVGIMPSTGALSASGQLATRSP